jgi:palmitoyl-protein thioesterase
MSYCTSSLPFVFLSFLILPSFISNIFVSAEDYLPVVQMHGMGDFAKDPMGMIPFAHDISKALDGAYVLNVQIGNGAAEDIASSFLMNMDKQVDYFHSVVSEDENLTNGFNAVGYSQGNLIIRGYIHRYNNPPVKNLISMHGPMMGVAGLPNCNMTSKICDEVDSLLRLGAYNDFVQDHLAQVNYFRDPKHLDSYLKHGHFLVDINQENVHDSDEKNSTYITNFESLESMVLVKALEDSMVWPHESEWFGFFQDGSQNEIVAMKDTPWYQGNWFGLKTLDENNKLVFETTPGNHLQFSVEYLLSLVKKYFK